MRRTELIFVFSFLYQSPLRSVEWVIHFGLPLQGQVINFPFDVSMDQTHASSSADTQHTSVCKPTRRQVESAAPSVRTMIHPLQKAAIYLNVDMPRNRAVTSQPLPSSPSVGNVTSNWVKSFSQAHVPLDNAFFFVKYCHAFSGGHISSAYRPKFGRYIDVACIASNLDTKNVL